MIGSARERKKMNYTSAIERIAFSWDTACQKSANGELDEYNAGLKAGMIQMLANIECLPYADVRNDVINYAHKFGRLLHEKPCEY